MEDHHWCLDREVVNKFAGLGFVWIAEQAAGTGVAHTGDVGIHPRPIKSEVNAIKSAVRVKMSINGIGMKSNEDDVAKLQWNKLQAHVGLGTNNGHPIN